MENISAFCRIKMRVDVNQRVIYIRFHYKCPFIKQWQSLKTQQNAISVMSLQYCRRN